jgi:hypothetical protein
MPRRRAMLLAAVAVVLVLAVPSSAAAGTAVVHDFSRDPLSAAGAVPLFTVRGDAQVFQHEPDTAARFAGDKRGSLAVTYDSTHPTARLFTPLPRPLGMDDGFVFGAVITIRPGIEADPFGFHPIAFGLFNGSTTGDDRTGDLSDFRADTFDTLEMAYFPNVSPFFGGPYLSAAAFGAARGADAFLDFSFGSVVASLPAGTTCLVVLRHAAGGSTLSLQAWQADDTGHWVPLPQGRVTADLSALDGFLVDSLGIAAYHDGFNVFSESGRSLLAVVDYDLLFAAVLDDGPLPAILRRLPGRIQPQE